MSDRAPHKPTSRGPHDWNLVYHSGALGDFVTTLPAMIYWRRHESSPRHVLLTRRSHGDMARRAGIVDEFWDLEERRFATLFQGDGSPIASPPPTGALLFTALDSPLVAALYDAGCGRVIVQPPFPIEPEPIVSYHLSLFGERARKEKLRQPLRELGLRLSAGEDTAAYRDAVLIHPGSGAPRKTWPAERFESLSEVLRQREIRVLWCLGPCERDFDPPAHDTVIRNASLHRLCAILTRVRGYVGNDSGVSHLASACRCPSVVLFGPSNERIWAPGGEVVEVLTPTTGGSDFRSREIDRIEVETVLAALERVLTRAGRIERK